MQNDYAQAEEKVKLAYMAVKTEIMTQKTQDSSYSATDNAGKLGKIVRDELTGSEWSVTPDGSDLTEEGTQISITYSNPSLKQGGIATNVPNRDGHADFTINLSTQDATLDLPDTSSGDAGNNGGQTSGNQTTGNTGSGVTIVAGRGTPEVSMGAKTFGTEVANNLSTMKGKFVKYPAGAWSYDEPEVMRWMGTNDAPYTNVASPVTAAPNSQGKFGGILLGTWAATGVDVTTGGADAQYKDADGNWAWQILGTTVVEGKTCATLMATHITEEYYHASGQSEASVNLLNGQNARKFRIYENTRMAVEWSGHAMTKAEADTLSADQRKATTLSGMPSMTSANYYWLGTAYNSSNLCRVDIDGGVSYSRYDKWFGVRPVVTLKSDILYSGSGTAEDPYVVGYAE